MRIHDSVGKMEHFSKYWQPIKYILNSEDKAQALSGS